MELLKNKSVSISIMDTEGNLSPIGVFQVIQDAVTELMGMHNVDGKTAKREYNAFWVYVKTRAQFVKSLEWNEPFTVNAFFSYISIAKIAVDVHITDSLGETVVYSRTELCALDIDTQRIRRTFTVGINPATFTVKEAPEMEFTKFDDADLPLYESVRVRSCDIDYAHHTNNSVYVRLMLNTYSVAETEALHIKEMEIMYAGQSFEGDVLDIKKDIRGNKHLFAIEKSGSPVIKCEIICRE